MINFQNTKFIASYGTSAQLPKPEAAEIVLSGRSNVGKSSLINAIGGSKKLARVSSTPGKTTTINYFSLADRFMLVDLPGYGYANRNHEEKKRWSDLMEGYFADPARITLMVQLLDMRHNPSEEDFDILDFIHKNKVPFIVALTKSDKLNRTEYKENLASFREYFEEFHPVDVIAVSVNEKASIEALRNCISNYLENMQAASV